MNSVLFVPQTDRNALLLAAYASALDTSWSVRFLRTTLFGSTGDIGRQRSAIPFEILEPGFLCGLRPAGLAAKIPSLALRRLHSRYLNFLRDLRPNLIVVGVDTAGIGRWTVLLARRLGIRTVVCQEGCRFMYARRTAPGLWVKKAVLNALSLVVYPSGIAVSPLLEYRTADAALMWGAYELRMFIRRGGRAAKATVVGDPRVPPRRDTADDSPKDYDLLFVDVPLSIRHAGFCEAEKYMRFRQELVAECGRAGLRVLYKPHPLSRASEADAIRRLAGTVPGCSYVTEGTPATHFRRVKACVTFPSTAVYEILAAGVPMLYVDLHDKYQKLWWDPVTQHGAGIKISSAAEVPAALRRTLAPDWLTAYRKASAVAAEDVVGPMDGKAGQRFAAALRLALTARWRGP